MRLRAVLLAGLCAVLGLRAADAGARSVVLAPPDSVAGSPAVAPAPTGAGALVAWAAGQRLGFGSALQIREGDATGAFGPTQTLLEAASVGGPTAVLRPDGGALLLVPRGDAGLPNALVALRRPAGGQPFASTTVVPPDGANSFLDVVASASNARGDLAAVVRHGTRAVLVGAPAGSDAISTTDVGASFLGGIAVGANGAVRLLTVESGQVLARSGAITGPVGEPQVLARVRNLPDLAVAIDRRGTATAAFQRASGAGITVVATRARAGGRFAPPVVLDRGPNSQGPVVVAGGSRTAVAWAKLTARSAPRVAFAGPTGGFGRALAPAAALARLRGEAARYQLGAGFPRLAAAPSGRILLTYPYGLTQAVHATVAGPGARTFARPVVVSALGAGGAATPVFLADGTPLIVTATGGAIIAGDGLSGPAPTLEPPDLSATPIPEGSLERGRVSTTVRCSESCVVTAVARITTGSGRDLVISRRYRGRRVVAAREPFTLGFDLTQAGKDRLAATGRGRAYVVVTAANRTGASRSVRRATST